MPKEDIVPAVIMVAVIVLLGFGVLIALVVFIQRKWKQRQEEKIREKHFRENHGLLLQKLISTNEDIADRNKNLLIG